MSRQADSNETQPPMIGEQTKIKLDLKTLAMIIGSVVVLVLGYSSFRDEVNSLKTTTQNHESQLFNIQTSVNKLERQSDVQTELLKYIAKGRSGPAPESAK